MAALSVETAFNGLTDQEKEYALHLSDASWNGGKICLLQCSVESAPIFLLFQKLFHGEGGVAAVETAAKEAGVSDEAWRSFMAFVADFYGNLGNYKSFGDTKLLPAVSAEDVERIIRASPAYHASEATASAMDTLWGDAGWRLWDARPRVLQFGQGEGQGGGVSCYLSANCTMEDANLAQRFMDEKKLLAYNTRLLKHEDGSLEIRVASALPSGEEGAAAGGLPETEEEWEGRTVRVRRGDYGPLLARVAESLRRAAEVAANDNQRNMHTRYAEAFRTGDVQEHVEGSRYWIRDLGPAVENYIGFIETYRDPAKCRAEWEGFVAVVNREMSAKFTSLVDAAEELLPLMPWPAEYEKDRFQRPDFTSLDVIAFASSGIPAGINIPNYDSVRQADGFKNVSLGNVLAARDTTRRVTFVRDEDQALMQRMQGLSFEVQVGLHELLGHGSGKLFSRDDDGAFNFPHEELVNPETGVPVESWYGSGETWDSKFAGFSSAYEECRAECVGIFLCPQPRVLEIFGYEPGSDRARDLVYANWLSMVRAGIVGLMFFNPATDQWMQAHMQARYVILQVLLEAGGGLVSVEGLGDLTEASIADGSAKEGEEGVHVKLDREKIESVGVPAIGAFLRKLQVFKSTADVARGKELFDRYSHVPEQMRTLRKLILAKRQPRQQYVQPVLERDGEGKVQLVTFSPDHKGMVESFVRRFPAEDEDLLRLWQADRTHFEV